MTAPAQLALLRYHTYPSAQDPCFSHLLICSTAPLEAERAYRPGITETVIEASAPKLAALRNDLQRFFNEPGAGEGRKRLRLVVRIHGYNVPLPAVEQEYAEAERKFHGDAQTMTVAPPDDYVLFVHYAWPSESFGAGGPLRWFRAMPVALLLLLILGGVLAITSSGVAALIGELLLGIAFTLTLLRIVVYFRDRERASSFGVFDAVEMIRALHHLVQDVIAGSEYKTRLDEGKAQRISLSFLGHSMGTMLTTSLIRVLSDVFDPQADAHIWQDNPLGPFGGKDYQPPATGREANEARPQRARVGDLFVLERLILVAADIPVWAITTGRSNNLASCLRVSGTPSCSSTMRTWCCGWPPPWPTTSCFPQGRAAAAIGSATSASPSGPNPLAMAGAKEACAIFRCMVDWDLNRCATRRPSAVRPGSATRSTWSTARTTPIRAAI